ncbi:MAG: hypothetical protein WAW86_02895 [Gammaproteobacteria bacterium]
MHSLAKKLRPGLFFYTLAAICSIYFLFEYYFIKYSALSTDEFVFARHILDYTRALPYRDFAPYKTILGYYLLSIPLFFSHGLFAPLFWIKTEITLINVICLGVASYWSLRFFDKRAILLAVLAIISNQLFLIYGSDLRVDMLTSWFCLFSALCILKDQFKLGGALLGIAFLISQKALWYVFAINGGLGLCWLLGLFLNSPLVIPREGAGSKKAGPSPNLLDPAPSRGTTKFFNLRSLITFNLASALPLVLYVIIWSFVSDFSTVFYNLFYEAYIQAGIDWYVPLYLTCWQAVLAHGPLLFFIWPLTFISLFGKQDERLPNRVFIISVASIALILFINYKQPFPYNFVFTIPAFFLLISEFITWIIQAPTAHEKTWALLRTKILIGAYSLSIITLVYIFSLSPLYYLIASLPLISYAYFTRQLSHQSFLYSFMSLFILTGIVYPLYGSVKTAMVVDGKYQQAMTQVTAELLSENGDYVSGIPFLYAKDQPIDGMKNLIGPAVDYLYEPTDKLQPLLLPSLYLTASSPDKILADFDRTPVKVVINNYRMLSLPPKISTYIKNNYQYFYGSIYLYAPLVTKNKLSIDIKFSGKYRVEGKEKARILLDNKVVKVGKVVQLKQGAHLSETKTAYRLVLVPKLKEPLDAQYTKDNWSRMIKAIVY